MCVNSLIFSRKGVGFRLFSRHHISCPMIEKVTPINKLLQTIIYGKNLFKKSLKIILFIQTFDFTLCYQAIFLITAVG